MINSTSSASSGSSSSSNSIDIRATENGKIAVDENKKSVQGDNGAGGGKPKKPMTAAGKKRKMQKIAELEVKVSSNWNLYFGINLPPC